MRKINKSDDKKIKELELSEDDFRKIIGSEWGVFEEKIIKNCFCGNCDGNYNSTIVDYTVHLNDLNDLILRGKCAESGHPIARYVETGENPEYEGVIDNIKRRYSKN